MADGAPTLVTGRLVIDDAIVPGRLVVESGRIASLEPDPGAASGPLITPGFVDLHVHGWGGHDAMGGPAALDGMARALLRRGVTSFLPTGATAPVSRLAAFADGVRGWLGRAPGDGARPLGFNLEGPFIAHARKGAHNAEWIRNPADVPRDDVAPLLEGLRLITIAPELPGALELIAELSARGVVCSMGHSTASLEEARAGYRAGGRTTTHLFNAMSGVDHHHPGLAVAALTDDGAWVELIADGHHVDRSLWPLILRTKPRDRVLLVSDAVSLAGMPDGRATIGGLEIEVRDGRCTLVVGGALAGSVIALDSAVRNLVREGSSVPAAVAAASANPAALLGLDDCGRIEVGRRADLVELDDELRVRRVMRGEDWIAGAG